MKPHDQRLRLILIVFASFLITGIAVLLTTPARPATKPTSSYTYDDARARPQETAQERERRQWQERWPDQKHCRLPACSTK